ncbi:MAG: T9SS type A sorting domain-containing protein [Flavobacteriales bacterium]|nr:T9SS type A sorting domain-containing protein [Flavobacteriales bacterium]
MKNLLWLTIFIVNASINWAQAYTSYFTGNSVNLPTNPKGGICLMGGATEDDNAMKWFLEQSDGGDILVLRASGSDGYNSYLYSSLGVPVNSVETIVFNAITASYDSYVHQKINDAEGIWFAGGDQWDYVTLWRDTPIADLINSAVADRNIAIGGTSAGMAVLGDYYFSAEYGTVTSSSALNNPYDIRVRVDSNTFFENKFLERVITDTHYDDPDRKGRHVAFLARMYTDYGVEGKGIACDEYTAVCIDTNGLARVFGGYPTYEDNAYFVQLNCELMDLAPENCTPGYPLNWNLGGEAIKACQVKGTSLGTNTFNLANWTSTLGVWNHWSVDSGVFQEETGAAALCGGNDVVVNNLDISIHVSPNPAINYVRLSSNHTINVVSLYNMQGKNIFKYRFQSNSIQVNFEDINSGIYSLLIENDQGRVVKKLIVE